MEKESQISNMKEKELNIRTSNVGVEPIQSQEIQVEVLPVNQHFKTQSNLSHLKDMIVQ